MAALKAHAGANAEVARLGCLALGSMCVNSADNCKRTGTAGGVEAAVAALNAHAGNNAEVSRQGLGVLEQMTKHAAGLEALRRTAGAEKVLRAHVAARAPHWKDAEKVLACLDSFHATGRS